MSGKSYRVFSRSSIDRDKRVRYLLWLRISLAVNAIVVLLWILSRRANPETPPVDLYVSVACLHAYALHALTWVKHFLASMILPCLQFLIVLDLRAWQGALKDSAQNISQLNKDLKVWCSCCLSYDTSQGCTIHQLCTTLLSMQATAAVLQTVKNRLEAETHTAVSHASDLANAIADSHIETAADGKLTAST